MLYRKNQDKVKEFINSNLYKSMLIVGVRQCGKTTMLKSTLKDQNMLYCNLEEREDIANIFNNNLTPETLIADIELLLNKYFDENKQMILIIDEIQVNPRAITSLKYFDESNLNIKVIGSGSLLGVELKQNDFSFPVGKVDILNMYPLDFEEFLINLKMTKHIVRIKSCFENNTKMPDSIHKQLIDMFHTFLEIGGMPQAVVTYIDSGYKNVNKIHTNLNESYLNDIAKYIDNKDKGYMRLILDNLGNELLKENQKFKLSNLKPGLKYSQIENSFAWLSATDITYKANIIDTKRIALPVKANVKVNKFKLFYCDTALLMNKMKYQLRNIKAIDQIYIGVVIENYIATEIYKKYEKKLYTYNDNRKEVDFLIERNNKLIPIEVKAAKNTKSKSLNVFMQQNDIDFAYRISEKNFGVQNDIKSIPHYAVFLI